MSYLAGIGTWGPAYTDMEAAFPPTPHALQHCFLQSARLPRTKDRQSWRLQYKLCGYSICAERSAAYCYIIIKILVQLSKGDQARAMYFTFVINFLSVLLFRIRRCQ